MITNKLYSKMAGLFTAVTACLISMPLRAALIPPGEWIDVSCDPQFRPSPPNADPERMRRAESGDPKAQNDLGEDYERRDRCDEDGESNYKTAIDWYRKSADQGYADAQYHIGVMYAQGKGVKKDQIQAVEWFQRAANQSDEYKFSIGMHYQSGDIVPKDVTKALALYRTAAEHGYTLAQDYLGQIYEKGEVVHKDLKQAVEWYQKAADQGSRSAQYHLGLMYKNGTGVTKSALKAAELFQKAAEKNNSSAQLVLGLMFENGEGVPQDTEKAFYWFRKYAEPSGSFRYIGERYEKGDGVQKNTNKADQWYRIASEWVRRDAENGKFVAQDDLGWMYEEGKGMPRDFEKAVEWYRRSADQGSRLSASRINSIAIKYENGVGVPKNVAYAAKLFQTAAEYGDSDAQFNLAVNYNTGKGVPKNTAKAVEWYTKAAEQGETNAQYNLGIMYASGDGVPKDLVLAYAWLNLASSIDSEVNKKASIFRDNQIAPRMTQMQIAEAQKLSSSLKSGDTLTRATYHSSSGDTDKQIAATSIDSNGRSPNTPGAQTLTRQTTGTAFFIGSLGHAVTNFHIVNGCKEITTEGKTTPFQLITTDGNNDLALLRLGDQRSEFAILPSEASKLRQGEEIAVFGYPLNTVLSSGGNLTPGVISALTGVNNNTSQIQITAPIQPGSSGSPVLDKRGNVIGVVAMKLSDSVMAEKTGTLGQNVNFAVSGQTLVSFLDAHQVQYKRDTSWFAMDKSLVDLADQARKWTVVVECWK